MGVTIHGSAGIDPTGTYRYWLARRWDQPADGRTVLWVMLNPSTADAEHDDATIRRCLRFSMHWRYARMVVVNLFALRATDPRELRRHPDPIGPRNDDEIRLWAERADLIVAAWGAHGKLRSRSAAVRRMLAGRLHCLGTTKEGEPRHPLYVPGDRYPVRFE